MDPVLRVTGKRFEHGVNGSPPFDRYEVAPDVFLTVFDDSQVRVTMDPAPGCRVEVKSTDARYPGRKMLSRVRVGREDT